ncbi:MAG: hypothetical protein KAI33_08535, partial [Elusimicrobiales bacterium]|nr:hypothetical protein [Elusimicrobiales bacterium]
MEKGLYNFFSLLALLTISKIGARSVTVVVVLIKNEGFSTAALISPEQKKMNTKNKLKINKHLFMI